MKRRLSVLVACLVALLGLAAPATSAVASPVGYPPTICPTLSISTTTPLEGAAVTVSGTNFTPNKTITLVMHSKTYVLGTVTTNAQGQFSTQVHMPSGVTGTHVITAEGGKTAACPVDPSVSVDIQATGGGAAGTGGTNGGGTAFTGVDILLLVLLAAALLGAGIALSRAGKRRKQVEWYAS